MRVTVQNENGYCSHCGEFVNSILSIEFTFFQDNLGICKACAPMIVERTIKMITTLRDSPPIVRALSDEFTEPYLLGVLKTIKTFIGERAN